jgi:hypothetical protein
MVASSIPTAPFPARADNGGESIYPNGVFSLTFQTVACATVARCAGSSRLKDPRPPAGFDPTQTLSPVIVV